jgi:hypothetical protein
MAASEPVSPQQVHLAAELRQMAELLELHPVANTALLQEISDLMRKIPEIPTNNEVTFTTLPTEVKTMVLDHFEESLSYKEGPLFLLVLGQVSTEWVKIVRYLLKIRDHGMIFFDENTVNLLRNLPEEGVDVERFADALRTVAYLQMDDIRLHSGEGIHELLIDIDPELVAKAVHSAPYTKFVMMGTDHVNLFDELFRSMHQDMNLEYLALEWDGEEPGGIDPALLLEQSARTLKNLTIENSDINSLITSMATNSFTPMNCLQLENVRVELDPGVVAEALCSVKELILNMGDTTAYIKDLIENITSPESKQKHLELWDTNTPAMVATVEPEVLAVAVSHLESFTVWVEGLTKEQLEVLEQLPGNKEISEDMFCYRS